MESFGLFSCIIDGEEREQSHRAVFRHVSLILFTFPGKRYLYLNKSFVQFKHNIQAKTDREVEAHLKFKLYVQLYYAQLYEVPFNSGQLDSFSVHLPKSHIRTGLQFTILRCVIESCSSFLD